MNNFVISALAIPPALTSVHEALHQLNQNVGVLACLTATVQNETDQHGSSKIDSAIGINGTNEPTLRKAVLLLSLTYSSWNIIERGKNDTKLKKRPNLHLEHKSG